MRANRAYLQPFSCITKESAYIEGMVITPISNMLPQLPGAQPQQPASQALPAAQAVANVAAVGVRTETRMAAAASGNSGGSSGTRGDKGRKADQGANVTEARTDRPQARLRGMGRRTDVTV